MLIRGEGFPFKRFCYLIILLTLVGCGLGPADESTPDGADEVNHEGEAVFGLR